MADLISKSYPYHIVLQFPRIPHSIQSFNFVPPRNCHLKPPITSFLSFRASALSNSAICNGWDDPILLQRPNDLGSSNQVQRFLISLGVHDKKYLIVYALGFLCALAISRIRVSSILLFPATAVVFAIGFSFGFVNGGPSEGVGLFGSKRRVKEKSFRAYGDKLKSLAVIFDKVDVKVGDLKSDISRAIDCKSVEVSDLEGYVNSVELIGLCVSNSRTVVDDCIGGFLVDDHEPEGDLNQNPGKRKKVNVQNRFNFFQFVSNFGRKHVAGSKPNKRKDTVVMGSKNASNPTQEAFTRSIVDGGPLEPNSAMFAEKMNVKDPDGSFEYQFLDLNKKKTLADRDREVKGILDYVKMDARMHSKRSRRSLDNQEFDYQRSDRIKFIDKQQMTFKSSEYNETGRWATSHDNLDLRVSLKHMETEASFTSEKIVKNSNGICESLRGRETTEHASHIASYTEDLMNAEDDRHSSDYPYKTKEGMDSPSSSTLSEDLMFDRYMTEANSLLKRAKECLKFREDEIQTEGILHDCAELLSKAVAMKPMSLLAVGQLGNTYLLHGELKLQISRQLRSLLSSRNHFTLGGQKNIPEELDQALPSRDRVTTLLFCVCQECEDLLVEAGRRYRTALCIDGSDVRALYNWGLALSFRAQLIADIGPEAVHDADKLFLAAIDKFDAMMARGNLYAPDALFRWGMALQQRSRLRPRRSAAKMKLLQQAKRLYEDAIDMGSDNILVREALSSCLSELD